MQTCGPSLRRNELICILTKAVEDLSLAWLVSKECAYILLDEWVKGCYQQSSRQRPTLFILEVHKELIRTWRTQPQWWCSRCFRLNSSAPWTSLPEFWCPQRAAHSKWLGCACNKAVANLVVLKRHLCLNQARWQGRLSILTSLSQGKATTVIADPNTQKSICPLLIITNVSSPPLFGELPLKKHLMCQVGF